MSEDNLLDKLRQKNRQRASVTQRKDPLFPENLLSEEKSNFSETDSNQNNQTTLEQLKKQLAEFPKTRRRSGIVLEEELDSDLTSYCKKNGITVETFLEAAWLIVSAREAILTPITLEAKKRYNQRKEAGQIRRLITALNKQTSC